MKRIQKNLISLLLVVSMIATLGITGFASASAAGGMRVGVGKADITGPITDISTGYNSLGDLMEGLLMRLYARAYIIESNGQSIVYATAELVHMTESIKPNVLKELARRGLTQYTEDNVMLSATHCHSSTSNVSWYALYDLINGVPGCDDESYSLIVQGIADAIQRAHEDLAPGSVSLAYANTDIGNYNRSLEAVKWNVNFDASKYASDYDAWKMSERAILTLQNCVDHLKQDFFTPSGSAFLHQVGSYQADLYEMMLLAGKEALAAADRIAQFRDPNADQPGIIEKDEAAAMLTEQEYNEIIHHQNLPAELRMIRGGLHKPEHSAERKTAFWVCSIVISAVIACVLYFTLGLKLFGGNDNFGDTFGDVFHFFCHIAPVLVIAGGIVCAIVYGMTWAEDENYNIVTYALSAGSAITGCAIGGALIYLLSLVITILWYALIVAIIVGIIVGVLDS